MRTAAKPHKKAALPKGEAAIANARAMGATSWDPIPPDCYQFQMDPQIRLKLNERRLYAWQLWRTCGNKRGGLTAACADHRGWLNLTHAHEDLGIPLAHLEIAQDGLEAKSLSRRDEQERLFPAGSIPHKRRRKYEGEEKENCGNELWPQLISTGEFLYLQSLSEDEFAQCEQDLNAIDEWSRRAEADARGAVREASQKLVEVWLRSKGYGGAFEHRGPPRKPHAAVDLQLKEFPQLSCENELWPQFEGIMAAMEKPNGHNSPSLLPSQISPQTTFGNNHRPCEHVENSSVDAAGKPSKEAAPRPHSTPFPTKTLPDEDQNAAVIEPREPEADPPVEAAKTPRGEANQPAEPVPSPSKPNTAPAEAQERARNGSSPEPSCPGCKRPLQREGGLGLKPPQLAPGEFTSCSRCGAVAIVHHDRSLRIASQEEIEEEVRMRPWFKNLVRAAEHKRREFLAHKSGFRTPAAGKRAAAKGGTP